MNDAIRPDSNGIIIIDTPRKTDSPQSFLPVLHGKATSAIASMSGKSAEPNQINDTASIVSGDVKIVMHGFSELMGSLGLSTHKLLSAGIACFTDQNHTGIKEKEIRNLRVAIPLKEYALKCGYDVEQHPTDTPEEAEKEAKRAKNALDNARKKIKKDLEVLRCSSLTWKETVKKKTRDFIDIGVLGASGIKGGVIYMEFTASMGEYLIQLPINQYPTALLGLDERKSNAYIIGLKMAEHSNNINNIPRNTAQLLRVKTLLKITNLPDIKTVKKNGNSWEDRIKEPLERCLDDLRFCGLLTDWYYSHSKGVELTDKEATFNDYEEWENTLIHFELANSIDHKPRIEAKARRIEEAKERKKRSRKNKDKAESKPTDSPDKPEST